MKVGARLGEQVRAELLQFGELLPEGELMSESDFALQQELAAAFAPQAPQMPLEGPAQ